jgi:hypothetical protein
MWQWGVIPFLLAGRGEKQDTDSSSIYTLTAYNT